MKNNTKNNKLKKQKKEINRRRFLRNCFLSSLDDLDSELNPILPISQKKIVTKIEDIWTDIYQASLQAEALQNANRSKTKAHLFESSFADYQLFYDFFANNT